MPQANEPALSFFYSFKTSNLFPFPTDWVNKFNHSCWICIVVNHLNRFRVISCCVVKRDLFFLYYFLNSSQHNHPCTRKKRKFYNLRGENWLIGNFTSFPILMHEINIKYQVLLPICFPFIISQMLRTDNCPTNYTASSTSHILKFLCSYNHDWEHSFW